MKEAENNSNMRESTVNSIGSDNILTVSESVDEIERASPWDTPSHLTHNLYIIDPRDQPKEEEKWLGCSSFG